MLITQPNYEIVRFKLSISNSELGNRRFILANANSVLDNKSYILANVNSILANRSFILANANFILANRRFILAKANSVLTDRSFIVVDGYFMLHHGLCTQDDLDFSGSLLNLKYALENLLRILTHNSG